MSASRTSPEALARAARAGARTAAAARAALAAGVDDPVSRQVLTVRVDYPTATLATLAARCSMNKRTYISRLNRVLVPLNLVRRPQVVASARAALAAGVDDPVSRQVLTVRVDYPTATLATLAARCSMTTSVYQYRLRRALERYVAERQSRELSPTSR